MKNILAFLFCLLAVTVFGKSMVGTNEVVEFKALNTNQFATNGGKLLIKSGVVLTNVTAYSNLTVLNNFTNSGQYGHLGGFGAGRVVVKGADGVQIGAAGGLEINGLTKSNSVSANFYAGFANDSIFKTQDGVGFTNVNAWFLQGAGTNRFLRAGPGGVNDASQVTHTNLGASGLTNIYGIRPDGSQQLVTISTGLSLDGSGNLTASGGGSGTNGGQIAIMSVTVTNITGNYSNLTELTMSGLESGTTRQFQLVAFVQGTNASGDGFNIDIAGGTATASTMEGYSMYHEAANDAGARNNSLTNFNQYSVSQEVRMYVIQGSITVGSGGTLIPRFRREITFDDAPMVLKNSYFILDGGGGSGGVSSSTVSNIVDGMTFTIDDYAPGSGTNLLGVNSSTSLVAVALSSIGGSGEASVWGTNSTDGSITNRGSGIVRIGGTPAAVFLTRSNNTANSQLAFFTGGTLDWLAATQPGDSDLRILNDSTGAGMWLAVTGHHLMLSYNANDYANTVFQDLGNGSPGVNFENRTWTREMSFFQDQNTNNYYQLNVVLELNPRGGKFVDGPEASTAFPGLGIDRAYWTNGALRHFNHSYLKNEDGKYTIFAPHYGNDWTLGQTNIEEGPLAMVVWPTGGVVIGNTNSNPGADNLLVQSNVTAQSFTGSGAGLTGLSSSSLPNPLLTANGLIYSNTTSPYGFAFVRGSEIVFGTNGVAKSTNNAATGKFSTMGDISAGVIDTVSTFGNQTVGTFVTSVGNLSLKSFGYIIPSSDGVWRFSNLGLDGYGRLQFGGTTATFPALKRNGAGFDIVGADGTYNSSNSLVVPGTIISSNSITATGGGANSLGLQVGGTALVVTNGSVGIGRSITDHTLDIVSGLSGVGVIRLRNTNSIGYGAIDVFDENDALALQFGYGGSAGISILRNAGYLGSRNATAPLYLYSYNNYLTPELTIKNGNIGIGTNAPTSRLHVVGGDSNIRTNVAQFDVTVTDFVIGTRYTNSTRRSFVAASFQLAAAVAGTAAVTLNVEQVGVTNRLTVSSGPLAGLTTIEPLALPVGPGAFYYFTDASSGSGAAASIVTGTSSKTDW